MSLAVTGRRSAALPMGEGVTGASLLRWARATLRAAGVEPAEREAIWLLEAALACSRLKLCLNGHAPVGAAALSRARVLVARRAAREPLQYLLGTQEFCGLDLAVTPEVLIPRPETTLLVDEVTRRVQAGDRPVIVDIGTGSGCIAIALARALPHAALYAIDRSAAALALARHNAIRHGLQSRIRFLHGDVLEPLAAWLRPGGVDVVVSNPPYIASAALASLQPEVRYEPRLALDGGQDGLAILQRLLEQGVRWLAPGGLLAVEVGAGQSAAVRQRAADLAVYDRIETRRDEASIERVVWMTRKG